VNNDPLEGKEGTGGSTERHDEIENKAQQGRKGAFVFDQNRLNHENEIKEAEREKGPWQWPPSSGTKIEKEGSPLVLSQ